MFLELCWSFVVQPGMFPGRFLAVAPGPGMFPDSSFGFLALHFYSPCLEVCCVTAPLRFARRVWRYAPSGVTRLRVCPIRDMPFVTH